MMKSKKAISAVVATVLIILITVAAVTIIWAAVIPMIQENIQGSTECFEADASFSIGSDYSCVDSDDEEVRIQVERKSGDYELDDVRIILGQGGTTESVKVSELTGGNPIAGGSAVYTIDLNGDSDVDGEVTLDDVDSATVAAIVKAGQSIEECSSGQMVEISECPSED